MFIYLSSILLEIGSGQAYYCKIRNGNNSITACNRVTVLAHCTSSDGHLPVYQVSFSSLLYFQRYAPGKLFIEKKKKKKKNKKGSNSVNTGKRVMVLAFYNLLYNPLSLYQFSYIYLQ